MDLRKKKTRMKTKPSAKRTVNSLNSPVKAVHSGKYNTVEIEKHYKEVFGLVTEGVLIADAESKRCLYANPAICKMLGYTSRELTSMTVTEIHPKYEQPFLLPGFEAMVRGEITYAASIPCLTKKGLIIHTDINSTRICVDGKCRLISFFTDIDNLKSAQHVLSNSEKHFKLILDQSFDGISICEYDFKTGKRCLILCNDMYAQMAGRSREELMAEDDLEKIVIFHGSEEQHEKCIQSVKDEKPCRGRCSWVRPDGKENYYDWVAKPVKIGDKYYIVGIDRDVTEKILARRALDESERRYKTIFDGAAEGILVADPQMRNFIYANPGICRMLGYSEQELMSMGVDDIHPKEHLPRVLDEFEAQSRGEKTLAVDIPCLCRDGSIKYTLVNTTGVILDSKKCMVGFFTDVTKLRQTQQELEQIKQELEMRVQQRTKELQRLNKKLRSLAAELSFAEEKTRRKIANDVHDHIGQNLAMAKVRLQSLAESIQAVKDKRIISEVSRIIAETIECTRSLTFEISPPVLYELGFEAAVEWLLRKARKQQGLKTDFQTDGQKKPLDENISVFLFQAVRELLINVAKHAKAKNVIVSVSRLDDQIQVSVADDGVGFDTNKLESMHSNPSGFGLFSIRERLSYIGGKLQIESKPGKGTELEITAPLT